ncbi:MAG: exonuclease domain-containing protein, partial [Bacteroidota bacterium]
MADELTWWERLNPFQKKKNDFDPSQYPSWYADYHLAYQAPEKGNSTSEVCFTVFDTETTGLNPKTDRMLSIGAIKVSQQTLQITKSFQRFLNPELARRRTKAVPVHGLLPDST